MLDQAFEALKAYDWGQDKAVLNPIEEAVVASYGDAGQRKELETRLAAVLKTDVPLDAKQYVCRKLMVIGTAVSVPALAELLTDKDLAHASRYALERIQAAEAGQALRDALSKTDGELKIGAIGSLGVRGEAESVEPLGALLDDGNAPVARAAAVALGAIRSSEAAKALAGGKPTEETKMVISDALLACAEALLAEGNKIEALATYKRLLAGEPAKHVRLAATRGMLECAK
jgi:HEAT repeat protein